MKSEWFPVQILIYEGLEAEAWAPGLRREVTAALLDQGHSVLRITSEAGRVGLRTGTGLPLVVLGRFRGPLPEIVDGNSPRRILTLEVAGADLEAILALVEEACEELSARVNRPQQPGAWKPWFPVIDYDRCTNCMQCLSFCLFDVYGIDSEKRIQVQNNDNCKTNCPACSRVCPEVAIMFPKYSSGPINGEEVRSEDVARESMKIDISSLLGGDIYSSLRNRSEKAKSRFSKERSPDKALDERKRCLTKLQQSGIIPAEVLAELDLTSLPSPEAIQRKARELAELRAAESGAESTVP